MRVKIRLRQIRQVRRIRRIHVRIRQIRVLKIHRISPLVMTLNTGYYITSVYQDVQLKYFDWNFSIRIIWFHSGINP